MIYYGDSVQLITIVYLCVLIPWTILFFHDYLSEKWVTIKHARNQAIVHILVAALPTPALLWYIVEQKRLPDAPDFKEMFAAVSALFLSVFHLWRTIWGLVQLLSFRRWAIRVAESLDSASYLDHYPSGAHSITASTKSRKRFGFRSLRNFFLYRKQNETTLPMHNNSFAAKPRQQLVHSKKNNNCYHHDRNISHKPSSISRKKPNKCWKGKVCSETIPEIIDRLLVSNAIVDNEIFSSSAPGVLWSRKGIRASDPLKTFVYWSVTYIAQLGREWLKDAEFDEHDPSDWTGRRQNLAAQVWATAVLCMEKENESSNMVVRDESAKLYAESILGLDDWEKLTAKGRDNLFSKEQAVRLSYSGTDGMPFRTPLLNNYNDQLPTHGTIEAHVTEIEASLPANLAAEVQSLEPYHIEWFAIFVGISKWKGNKLGYVSYQSTKDEERISAKSVKQDHLPVLILRDQLGLDEPPSKSICAFPFIQKTYGNLLWRHDTILQVSARIDNWIALSIGQELENLLQNEMVMKEIEHELTHGGLDSSRIVQMDSNESFDIMQSPEEDGESTNKTFARQKELETKRLQYQLGDDCSKRNHHEQGLSFMGCIMETVRLQMANYMKHVFSDNMVCQSLISNESIKLSFSPQLSTFLLKPFDVSQKMTEPDQHHLSFLLKERILWECQNGVYWIYESKNDPGVSERNRSLLEIMMLVIMGFPSIVIEAPVMEIVKGQSTFHLFLKPLAAPQNLGIRIKLQAVDSKHSLQKGSASRLGHLDIVKFEENSTKVVEEDDQMKFCWEEWRDSFEGRLQGKANWQRNHFMPVFSVHHTTNSINSGVSSKQIWMNNNAELYVWEGWRPFRAGLSTFELEHSPLFTHGKDSRNSYPRSEEKVEATESSTDTHSSRYPSILPSQSLNFRKDETDILTFLTDASLYLTELFHLNRSLINVNGEIEFDTEDDKTYFLVPNSYSDPELQMQSPSSSTDGENKPFNISGAFFTNFKQRNNNLLHNTITSDQILEQPLQTLTLEAKAQKQDPSAMYKIASQLIDGSKAYRKNVDKALLILERALLIGKEINTATLLVKTLLERTSNATEKKRKVYIDRAIKAVNLLWRDLKRRQDRIENKNGKVEIKWTGPKEKIVKEEKRMKYIVTLHRKILRVRNNAEFMFELGRRLCDHDTTGKYQQYAENLFESAIVAEQHEAALLKLIILKANNDKEYAKRLVQHVIEICKSLGPELFSSRHCQITENSIVCACTCSCDEMSSFKVNPNLSLERKLAFTRELNHLNGMCRLNPDLNEVCSDLTKFLNKVK